jgi:hypothetical protein
MTKKYCPPFVGEEGEMKLKDKPYERRGFKYECLKYDNITFMNMTLNRDNIEYIEYIAFMKYLPSLFWCCTKKIRGKKHHFPLTWKEGKVKLKKI